MSNQHGSLVNSDIYLGFIAKTIFTMGPEPNETIGVTVAMFKGTFLNLTEFAVLVISLAHASFSKPFLIDLAMAPTLAFLPSTTALMGKSRDDYHHCQQL